MARHVGQCFLADAVQREGVTLGQFEVVPVAAEVGGQPMSTAEFLGLVLERCHDAPLERGRAQCAHDPVGSRGGVDEDLFDFGELFVRGDLASLTTQRSQHQPRCTQ
jgi:hypothetical protein